MTIDKLFTKILTLLILFLLFTSFLISILNTEIIVRNDLELIINSFEIFLENIYEKKKL